MDEIDRAEIGRSEGVADVHICPGIRKDAGVAQVDSCLAAEFGSERNGVADRTGHRLVDEVGLVECVFAVGDVVIGIVAERAGRQRDRAARIDVLVAAVEVRIDRRILDGEPASEVVLDHGHRGLHIRVGVVVDRTAEEGREIAVRRERRRWIETGAGADRRVAAIGDFPVVIEFVAQLDLGIVVRLQRDRRVESVALEMAVIAERVAALIKCIEAHRDIFVHRLPGVERDTAVAVGACLCRRFIDPAFHRLP